MRTALGNRLLDSLSLKEFELLSPHLRLVDLTVGEFLGDPNRTTDALYFPTTAVISTVGMTEQGATVEVALTGRDGVAGAFDAMGQLRPPFRLQVLLEGKAYRADARLFREQLKDCGELIGLIHTYVQSLIVQVSQSAVCNRFHTSEQRLARWLLTTALASGDSSFPLTHEAVAQMVGGPRSGISRAAARLRDAGTIDYSRGRFLITDRGGLERAACECYRVVEEALLAPFG